MARVGLGLVGAETVEKSLNLLQFVSKPVENVRFLAANERALTQIREVIRVSRLFESTLSMGSPRLGVDFRILILVFPIS